MALEGEKGQGSASDTDTDTDTTGKQERLSGTIKKLFAGRLMNYIEVGCLEQISKTDGQQCPGLFDETVMRGQVWTAKPDNSRNCGYRAKLGVGGIGSAVQRGDAHCSYQLMRGGGGPMFLPNVKN